MQGPVICGFWIPAVTARAHEDRGLLTPCGPGTDQRCGWTTLRRSHPCQADSQDAFKVVREDEQLIGSVKLTVVVPSDRPCPSHVAREWHARWIPTATKGHAWFAEIGRTTRSLCSQLRRCQ
jgi:hypothetical protein